MVDRSESAPHSGVSGSIIGAVVLLAWDAVLGGGFVGALPICLIWFLVSLLKNAIQRPGSGLALLRIGIPVTMLGLFWANEAAQLRVAEARAHRVVAACEAYHAANGKFPEKLDELVPQYMPYVPSARYCPGPWSQFEYHFNEGKPWLFWYIFPPYDRKIYDFETRRWHYMS